jgi:hypothetical protein
MAELLAMGVRIVTVLKWCLGLLFHSHRLLFCLSEVSLSFPFNFHFSFSDELLLLLLLLVMLMLMLVMELLLLLLLLHLLLSIPLLCIHPLKLSSALTLSHSLRVRWLKRLCHRQWAWISKLRNLADRRLLRQRHSLRLRGIAFSLREAEMWQLLMHGTRARRYGLLCPLRHRMSWYSKRDLVRLREGSLGRSLGNRYTVRRDMLLLPQWLRRCRLNFGLW